MLASLLLNCVQNSLLVCFTSVFVHCIMYNKINSFNNTKCGDSRHNYNNKILKYSE